MKNRLIADDQRMMAYPGATDGRCTGTSTAQAFELIAKAIREPSVDHLIHDHQGSVAADRHLTQLCEAIVAKLGLAHFTFGRPLRSSHVGHTIRCDLLVPDDQSVLTSSRVQL